MRNGYLNDLFDPGKVFLLFLKINIYIFMGHIKQNALCCIASNFYLKRILLTFIVILREFCEAKFIRGTSLLFSTVI